MKTSEKNLRDLQNRMEAFNQSWRIEQIFDLYTPAPFNSSKNVKDPAKLFDELFPPHDSPINQPSIKESLP